jgi:predicted CoA-binding protein
MPLPYAIMKAPPSYYQNKPQNIEIALSMVESVSDITRVLIDTGSIAAAERISGAYLETGNSSASRAVINDMKLAGYTVKPVNPFAEFIPSIGTGGFRSPSSPRIIAMWNKFRSDVIELFPESSIVIKGIETDSILNSIREKVNEDAYHSLSIEGYRVTVELIARIRSGEWNPEADRYDNNQRNALAVKGYSLAYDEVLKSVR